MTETLDDSSGDVSLWDVFQIFFALAAWGCDIICAMVLRLFRRRRHYPLIPSGERLSMEPVWHYRQADDVGGPVSLDELHRLAESGRLKALAHTKR